MSFDSRAGVALSGGVGQESIREYIHIYIHIYMYKSIYTHI